MALGFSFIFLTQEENVKATFQNNMKENLIHILNQKG
jgi:hypothetical protein